MDETGLARFFGHYGGAAVFAAVALETFLAFLPTPPVVLGAGALLVPPGTSPAGALAVLSWRVALPGALATAVGALGLYGVFWLGGRPLVERFGRWFGVTWKEVEKLERRLARRRALLIFGSRALPVVPTALVSAGCGVLRVAPVPFFWWTLAGAFPRWLLVAWLGWAGKGASLSAYARIFG